jgi:hypothetical protein
LPESVERARLIPVLTTILRLSKEEVEKVHAAVAGKYNSILIGTGYLLLRYHF